MKFSRLFCLAALLSVLPAHAEEHYFRFPYPGKSAIQRITRVVSIDSVKDGWVYAYANDQEWARWQAFRITAEPLPHPGTLNDERCATSAALSRSWATYPSHTAYLEMMQNFAKNHPSLCEVSSYGKSVKNRSLMIARITSNLSANQPKPKVFLGSTMHGDETTGYALLLRLADFLVTNYNQNTEDGRRVTRLLDATEVWISPLLNPDGTYRSNDSAISSPTRGNANGVDLNRNFPDQKDGQHPDGQAWQVETQAMMDLCKRQAFVLGANMHGGAELANYPWDNLSARHVDDAWWIDISRRYASNVQAVAPSGTFTDRNNGVTNGYDWYAVAGGRQDYANYYYASRELTLEMTTTKFLPSSQLDAQWGYHKNAMLTFIEEATKGVRGKVTDAQTGKPVAASVGIQASNEIPVKADPATGTYFRVLRPGTYTLVVKAAGYTTKTVSNVTVGSGDAIVRDIQLQSTSTSGITFTTQPASQTVNAGAQVTFTVAVTGGTAPYAYQWKKNGTVVQGASGASLTFTAASADNGATYQAVVTDSSNPALTGTSQSATLTVNQDPGQTTLNETEKNDTIATANAAGSSINRVVGYMGVAKDKDHFSLKVAAGRTLTVSMAGPSGSSYDYDLYFYNPSGTKLASGTGATTTEKVTWKNSGTSEATVILQVDGYKGSSTQQAYTLSITR